MTRVFLAWCCQWAVLCSLPLFCSLPALPAAPALIKCTTTPLAINMRMHADNRGRLVDGLTGAPANSVIVLEGGHCPERHDSGLCRGRQPPCCHFCVAINMRVHDVTCGA